MKVVPGDEAEDKIQVLTEEGLTLTARRHGAEVDLVSLWIEDPLAHRNLGTVLVEACVRWVEGGFIRNGEKLHHLGPGAQRELLRYLGEPVVSAPLGPRARPSGIAERLRDSAGMPRL